MSVIEYKTEYPVIKTAEETKLMIDNALAIKDSAIAKQKNENNFNRIKAIETMQKSLQSDFDRYYKKKKSWSKATNFLDYTETFIGVGSSIAAGVGGIVTLNPIIPVIIVAVSAALTTLCITIRKSIFNREYKKFAKKLKYVCDCQNQMLMIMEGIKEDGEVTTEELAIYVKYFDAYRNKKIEDVPDEITAFQRDMDQRVLAEAKQQIEVEYKEIEKQKKLNDLRSKLNIPNLPSTSDQIV